MLKKKDQDTNQIAKKSWNIKNAIFKTNLKHWC